MKFFDPAPHQRVWRQSADRQYDIYELRDIHEIYRPGYAQLGPPWAYGLAYRPNRYRGVFDYFGPRNHPFAGAP